MIRRPPRSTLSSSSAASDVYKRQVSTQSTGQHHRNMDVQREKAFQKQPHMFAGKCRNLTRGSRKGARFVKSCGLGFKTPTTAMEGRYIDKKCPFTGNVSIRGKIIKGLVAGSGKMTNTITVRREYMHYQTKYKRYEKRHKMVSAHCTPAFTPVKGDEVTLGQCRPLSKTCLLYTSPSPRDS
eukprot:TRINITY_DN1883_c0_g1_i12.p1 TRINITY_DN1883_c0_g1~~TRINITY_DN1883_c0_g1_i12.p1  ORF type:complete len:182 (-),score=66.54 TRINITY_DN1883_c0_g1_i12:107-652(-)